MTVVEHVEGADLDRRWPRDSEAVLSRIGPDGEPYIEFLRDDELGFRITALGHGDHLIAPDGGRLWSALPDVPAWRHMKLLGAQVLPLIAALHGRELLHASAVAIDERVVALTAPSGTGKSSVAAHLTARGATFVADDQLALERRGDELVVHPGPRYSKLHAHEREAVAAEARDRLGAPLGEDGKLHLAPEGPEAALPLGALVVLGRVTDEDDGSICTVEDPARAVLSSAYLGHFEDPERLMRHLDVAAALASSAPVVRVGIRPGEQAPDVAARIEHWWRSRTR